MEEEKLQPRECEKCNNIVYYHKGKQRNSYILFAEDACQIGMSIKYPNELGGYCKEHQPV